MTTRSNRASTTSTARKTRAFIHYFDQHPTEEDLMGESTAQSTLIFYLQQVLTWMARIERWFVVSNLNIYRAKQRYEYPLAPDLAVFKGVDITNRASRALRSWRLYQPDRPAPSVVFEISSDSTWEDDLELKPAKYAAMGVQEYFVYDPNDPPYWPINDGRLRGWYRSEGTLVEQTKDEQGRLWSNELQSWLVSDGAYLRLYDNAGQQRPTESEAARTAEATERLAKETARTAEANERLAKERAWAKLRELGIDPTDL